MTTHGRIDHSLLRLSCVALAFLVGLASVSRAQNASDLSGAMQATSPPPPGSAQQTNTAQLVTCASQPGERQHCASNTSSGVVLRRSTGESPCLLGKTWGYDDTGIWVSDGCTAEFVVGNTALAQAPQRAKPLEHIPNVGFLIYDGDEGQIYMRLFTYARYLNQRALNSTYTDAFGNVHTVQLRQDMQLQKFFLPFSGWFLTPKFRYYLYVWSANTSQGDPAQVVGAGNISYAFNRFVTAGFGITSLPSVRSTEGQFPYWLGVDDRLIADEYFRGSYTTGVWLKGEVQTKVKYMAMFANNLSTLGVSAAQLDNKFDTQSFVVTWLPTTGEFGPFGTFGDFEGHEKLATRVGIHFTHSLESKQSQPGTDGIENTQIRLADGSIIFTPDLFGPGISVNTVNYRMMSLDAGAKMHGFAVEGEYYRRWLGDYTGLNIAAVPNVTDNGYQMQTSAMPIPKTLQGYFSWSQIFGGTFGSPWEIRGGANWFIRRQRGLRVNAELIHVHGSPVGYTAYPMPVGATGNIIHLNFEMNF